MKSKVVALSAISASFVAIVLTLGAYIELVDLVAVVLSSIFVVLPLYYKSYVGSVLCYLVGGIIAFLISGFNILSVVFPAYFGFFGLFPIIKILMQEKGANPTLSFIIGLVWCVLAMYGIYFYYVLVMGEVFSGLPLWVEEYLIYIVGLVGVVFYLIFNKYVEVGKTALDKYLSRILK